MNRPVLIAEDKPVIAMILREIMTDEGYAAEVVNDGLTALRRLREEPVPAIVLLDLSLPGLSGREVIAAMRSSPRLARVPVVLITGAIRDSPDFPPPGTYEAIIGKPFDSKDVLTVVQRLIGPAV